MEIILEKKDEKITSVQKWIKICKELHEEYSNKTGNRLFFRGHSKYNDNSHKLIPHIARYKKKYKKEKRLKIEKELLHRFTRHYYNYDTATLSDWQILFIAQHYGLPTRLLDLTSNPLAALFFAVEKDKNQSKESAVFAVIGKKLEGQLFVYHDVLKDIKENKDPLDNNNTINGVRVIYPCHSTQRIKAQKGLFLFYGDPFKKLENLYKENLDDKYKVDIESVYKYPIPKGFRKTIKKELAQLGINHQTLFPDDLDKLTESLLWSQFELPNIK